jgi:hypothetical protein
MVEVDIEEVEVEEEALLTPKAKELLVAGKKLLMCL